MKKRGESGFAMLLVFLMAATIAITLYLEIPRVAFQAQRQKEQLLIERGQQYQRAIQLFVRVNGRYPGDLKDLESFNNRRFLRHKFIDPMTGKDDWRIIHINNGVLTDSVLNKNKPGTQGQQAASTAGQYVGEQAGLGVTPIPGQQTVSSAITRRRVSDGGVAPTVGPDGQPLTPGQPASGFGTIPGQPLPGQPIPGQPLPGQQISGQPMPGQVFPGQPVAGQPIAQPFPGAPVPGSVPAPFTGGQTFPGQVPGQPFAGTPTNAGQVPGQPFNGAQPAPGTPVPPTFPNQTGGLNPNGQPIPGRVPGFVPGGAQTNPNSSGQSYVSGTQPYVGGTQPYVGGGQYIGSQAAPTAPTPPPTTPYTPGQFGSQPVQAQPVTPTPVPPQSSFPGMPGFGQIPGGAQAPGTPQTANPGMPGQNPAADMINNILRNPRPVQTGTSGTPLGGQQVGGGIAGVASKSEDPAIMVYNDHTNYNEWEFIFDYTKQQPLPNPNGGTIGTSAASLGSLPGSPSPLATPSPTAAVNANPGAFGAAGPLGGQTTLGQTTLGQTNPGQTTPGQTAPGQTGAGQTSGAPKLPPGLRPGRP